MDYKLRGTEQILKAVFLSMLMVLVLPKFTQARVTGQCSNCHTMHNSQNAATMIKDPINSQNEDPSCIECHNGPRSVLLRMNCVGCHGQDPEGASNIIALSNIPQVAHNAATDLAGGNYKNVFSYDDRGHNVHGFKTVIPQDNILHNTPPGYKQDYDPSSGKYTPGLFPSADQVMCAGRNGCHGNRDQTSQMMAIKGAHHADDKILKFGADFTETGQGDSVGTSYRFLYKVHGGEDNDWQATSGAADHNEYKGAPLGARGQTQTWSDVSTISDLCAECHGKFHAGGLTGDSGIGSASPWLRHPTDVILPNSGEYSAYNTDGITYSLEAPVARQTIPNAASGTIALGSDVVMCLSCHKAHASQYPDALRWDYSNMSAGRGCYICHTQKDDNL